MIPFNSNLKINTRYFKKNNQVINQFSKVYTVLANKFSSFIY